MYSKTSWQKRDKTKKEKHFHFPVTYIVTYRALFMLPDLTVHEGSTNLKGEKTIYCWL